MDRFIRLENIATNSVTAVVEVDFEPYLPKVLSEITYFVGKVEKGHKSLYYAEVKKDYKHRIVDEKVKQKLYTLKISKEGLFFFSWKLSKQWVKKGQSR